MSKLTIVAAACAGLLALSQPGLAHERGGIVRVFPGVNVIVQLDNGHVQRVREPRLHHYRHHGVPFRAWKHRDFRGVCAFPSGYFTCFDRNVPNGNSDGPQGR